MTTRTFPLTSILVAMLLSTPLLASVTLTAARPAVEPGDSHQQAGALLVRIDGDDFAEASAEHPLLVELKLGQGALLAETRVDQEDPEQAQPLYLPLRADAPTEVTLVAAKDALRVVRWVHGEDAIWLEVSQSSSLWLEEGGSPSGPSTGQVVVFALGESARQTDQAATLGRHANLPFATRNLDSVEGQYSQAESQLLCVDLSDTELTPEQPLTIAASLFDEGARDEFGHYRGENPHRIATLAEAFIAHPVVVTLRQAKITLKDAKDYSGTLVFLYDVQLKFDFAGQTQLSLSPAASLVTHEQPGALFGFSGLNLMRDYDESDADRLVFYAYAKNKQLDTDTVQGVVQVQTQLRQAFEYTLQFALHQHSKQELPSLRYPGPRQAEHCQTVFHFPDLTLRFDPNQLEREPIRIQN